MKTKHLVSTKELAEVLEHYVQMFPAFRSKPIGAEGSNARAIQDAHIAAEDKADSILAKLRKVAK